jgi:hypothetical protein
MVAAAAAGLTASPFLLPGGDRPNAAPETRATTTAEQEAPTPAPSAAHPRTSRPTAGPTADPPAPTIDPPSSAAPSPSADPPSASPAEPTTEVVATPGQSRRYFYKGYGLRPDERYEIRVNDFVCGDVRTTIHGDFTREITGCVPAGSTAVTAELLHRGQIIDQTGPDISILGIKVPLGLLHTRPARP